MRLEILHPRHFAYPYKEMLKKWYLKLGFQVVHDVHVEERYPELVESFGLACECDALLLTKDTSSA